MKDKGYLIVVAILSLILVLNMGCDKTAENENENPTIKFLQPNGNLTISSDTVITFIAVPTDKDGTIEKVEFSIDGNLMQTILSAPYQFNWSITTHDNLGIKIVKAIAYDNNGAKAEVELQIEITSYLSQWFGTYEGTSYHWMTYPTEINGEFQLITFDSYKDVLVNVSLGSNDSTLDFGITYNDSITEVNENIIFSASGIHFSEWGSGSGYGSLNISFESDSLHYVYQQKCGIPCDRGVDFDLKKN